MSELFNLDEVSLQCFTNKHVYKKYLAKKYPTSAPAAANTETRQKALMKADELIDLFTQLLHNTSPGQYNILNSKYLPFIEACLDHLEKKERQERQKESTEKEAKHGD